MSKPRCTFCGKSQKDAACLIAGDGVWICDVCVGVCNDILEERLLETPLRAPADTDLGRIEAHIRASVPGQHGAVRQLAAIVYNQHARARAAAAGKPVADDHANVFLTGPIGSGKTLAVRAAAEAADLPLAIVDAASFVVRRHQPDRDPMEALVHAARKIRTSAHYAILLVDNAHALLTPPTADGSIRHGQQKLLPILNGTATVDPKEACDSRRVLVVCCGTFPGLASLDDLTAIGFLPEFAAHFGVLCRFEPLPASELRALLTKENGLLADCARLFEREGVELRFSTEVVDGVVREAERLGTGTRGLRCVMDNLAIAVSMSFDARPPEGPFEVGSSLLHTGPGAPED
ncbi:MAG TPA: ClpX C4-type zinc finger protein [Thermoanaerobaculia bacterium]|nr:ClpX C4-type zinc finger protein [Thermoanaerobaculia bacterium]